MYYYVISTRHVLRRYMKIRSSQIVNALSFSGKSLLNLNTNFDISTRFYDLIKKPIINPAVQQQLLFELFKINKRPEQRAIVGNLLVEHRAKLPFDVERLFILSMLKSNYKLEAWNLYRRHRRTNKSEQLAWDLLGLEVMCETHRVIQAEKLLKDTKISVTPKIAFLFLNAYAELNQTENLNRWLESYQNFDISKYYAFKTMYVLIRTGNVPQAHQFYTAKSDLLGTEMIAEFLCLSSTDDELILMKFLSCDGNLANMAKFQNLLKRDIRKDVSELLYMSPSFKQSGMLRLHNNRIKAAIEIIKDYNGCHKVFLCHQILEKTNDPILMKELYNMVIASNIPDSMYVHFMLLYYRKTSEFDEAWNFILKYQLHTTHPNIKGKLRRENYTCLWGLIHRIPYTRVPLCDIMLATLNQTALTPALLHKMVLALNAAGDHSSVAVLYEYSIKECGISDQFWMDCLINTTEIDFGYALARAEPLRKKLGL